MSLVVLFSTILHISRILIGVAFVLSVVVGLTHLLIREGKLNAFGGWAKLVRRWSDPLLAPIERQLRAAGGNPQHAPWWLVGIIAIGGLILIELLKFVLGTILRLVYAATAGPQSLLYLLVDLTFTVLMFALLVRVFSSWFGATRHNRWIAVTYRLTDWIVEPIRRVMPTVGMFDFSPLVAYLVLMLLRSLVMGSIL